jgi:hypothetical protein
MTARYTGLKGRLCQPGPKARESRERWIVGLKGRLCGRTVNGPFRAVPETGSQTLGFALG